MTSTEYRNMLEDLAFAVIEYAHLNHDKELATAVRLAQRSLDAIAQDQAHLDDELHAIYGDDLHADGDALASAGMGTDEDYGHYGEEAA